MLHFYPTPNICNWCDGLMGPPVGTLRRFRRICRQCGDVICVITFPSYRPLHVWRSSRSPDQRLVDRVLEKMGTRTDESPRDLAVWLARIETLETFAMPPWRSLRELELPAPTKELSVNLSSRTMVRYVVHQPPQQPPNRRTIMSDGRRVPEESGQRNGQTKLPILVPLACSCGSGEGMRKKSGDAQAFECECIACGTQLHVFTSSHAAPLVLAKWECPDHLDMHEYACMVAGARASDYPALSSQR